MNKLELIAQLLRFVPVDDQGAGREKLAMLDLAQLQQRLDMLERVAARNDELHAVRAAFAPGSARQADQFASHRQDILAQMKQSMAAFSNSRAQTSEPDTDGAAVARPAPALGKVVPLQRHAKQVQGMDELVIRAVPAGLGSRYVHVVVMKHNGQVVESLGKKFVGRMASKYQGSELVQKYRKWVEKGAQPTPAVERLLAASPSREQRFMGRRTALKANGAPLRPTKKISA